MYTYEIIVTRTNGKDEEYTKLVDPPPFITVRDEYAITGELKGRFNFYRIPMSEIRTISIFVTHEKNNEAKETTDGLSENSEI